MEKVCFLHRLLVDLSIPHKKPSFSYNTPQFIVDLPVRKLSL